MKTIAWPAGAVRISARLPVLVCAAMAVCALAATSASALTAHGQLLKVGPRLRSNTNTSGNWFGYNQGTLEQGSKLFNSIGGQWTVPTVTQHTAGQAEASSDWIGIGGGCVDAGCTATDSTLIQTGTEQDVSATGQATYNAWYELVPAPELQITSLTVHPGDRMSASVSEVVSNSNAWNVTLKDLTTGQSFSTTVPYSSTHTTAEWIEETPLLIGTNAGFAALPNLSNPAFGSATTNGQPAGLKTSEELDLTDSNGNVIGAPSAPNATADGFDACTWATSCS
jgi:hypothetical protein